MLSRFTKQEANRKEQINRKLLAVGREVRRGRAHYRSTRDLLEELRDLCGSWKAVADAWSRLVEDSAQKRPGGLRAINQLRAMFAVIREAGKPAVRQPKPTAVPFDPAGLTDEELAAGMEEYQKQQSQKT